MTHGLIARSVTVAATLAAVLVPATFYARHQATGASAGFEERRALAIARRVIEKGGNDAALVETVRAIGPSGSPGMRAAFVRTPGDTGERGVASASHMLALGPDGLPVVLPGHVSGSVQQAGERASSLQAKGDDGVACMDGGPEAPILCAITTRNGTLAGVVAGRTDIQAPFGWPVTAAVAGAMFFLFATWAMPSWHPVVMSAVSATLAGAAGAGLLAMGVRPLLDASALASASLAINLGTENGMIMTHQLPLGPGFVVVTTIVAAAISSLGILGINRLISDDNAPPRNSASS